MTLLHVPISALCGEGSNQQLGAKPPVKVCLLDDFTAAKGLFLRFNKPR
jgi:hypothetical protein